MSTEPEAVTPDGETPSESTAETETSAAAQSVPSETVDPSAAAPQTVPPQSVPSDTVLSDETEELGEITDEAIVALIAERDEYLEALQRLKAEFANARRRSEEQAVARRSQAAADLVEKLLPVLDSCDAALAQGIEEVRPIGSALFDVLSGQGLERVDATNETFDPELHEAVMYEEGDAGTTEQVVTETLRTGYRWNERILRTPMVKVKG